MHRSLRWAAATAALALAPVLADNTLQAQGRPMEFRVDFFSLETSDGTTVINLEFPGSFALGFFLNPQFAIEPAVSFTNVSDDDIDGTIYGFGVFLPFYAKADHGKSGLFIAPGIALSGGSGDFDSDSNVDFGVDLGFKKPIRDKISARFALTLRDGDSYDKAAVGGSFGLTFHWQ